MKLSLKKIMGLRLSPDGFSRGVSATTLFDGGRMRPRHGAH